VLNTKPNLSVTLRYLLAVAVAMLGLTSPALGQLDLSWFTINSGGQMFGAGATFQMGSTIGQPDAGILSGGGFTLSGGFWFGGTVVTSVPEEPLLPDEQESTGLPLKLRIGAELKNPFRDNTGIRLELPSMMPVEVSVYDLGGRMVRRLYNDSMPAGIHNLVWNGRGNSGQRLASSVYVLVVQAGSHVQKWRVVLLR